MRLIPGTFKSFPKVTSGAIVTLFRKIKDNPVEIR